MKFRALQLASLGLIASAFAFALSAIGQEPAAKPRKVVKTDAEWRKQLSPMQYAVTRQAETEPAFSGKLLTEHRKGIFECVCCDTPLFNSTRKFDSGTGWPSFDFPYAQANIATATDYKLGYERTEVTCNVCGAHLGHVFNDGPTKTGLRFCMNSAALKFVRNAPSTATKPAAKDKAKKTNKTEKTDKTETKDEPAKDATPADTPK